MTRSYRFAIPLPVLVARTGDSGGGVVLIEWDMAAKRPLFPGDARTQWTNDGSPVPSPFDASFGVR